MSFNHLARYAALFWGLVVFMPVGLNYLAFFTLILCMAVQSGRVERVRRVRQHPIFWPLAAFVLWSIVVLVLQPTLYEQTPSNLWHIVRIAVTLALALALKREEAVWALRGFALAVIAALVVIGVNHLIGLPDWTIWSSLIKITGNKTVAAGSGIVIALDTSSAAVRTLALVLVCAVLVVIVWALPNRTSLLILMLAPAAVLCHQWRQYRAKLIIALAAVVVLAGSLLVSVPSMHAQLAQGLNDIERALEAGQVSGSSVHRQSLPHTTCLTTTICGWALRLVFLEASCCFRYLLQLVSLAGDALTTWGEWHF